MNINASQILASAGAAINLLSAAGVPIPPALINTAEKALPIISAAVNIAITPPQNVSQAIDDLATIAGAVQKTGLAPADSEIENILAEVQKYAAVKSNLESGQAVVDFTFPYSLNGVQKKAYTVTFLEGGSAAQLLGL